jgi:membrane protein
MSTASVDPSGKPQPESFKRLIWSNVSHSPLRSLWDLQGISLMTILKRTAHSFQEDNLLSRAAELGYYFLFALFPTLLSASSIFGLFARSQHDFYPKLLNYLSLVVPPSALGIVLETFNQTAKASSGGKFVFGLAAALWAASVGFTAIQDTLNIVYKVRETRPYWKVRGAAMLVTLLLAIVITIALFTLFAGDFTAHFLSLRIPQHMLSLAVAISIRTVAWVVTTALLMLIFAIIYYYAPDVRNKTWHWLTPGAAVGIFFWIAASVVLRLYLHYFNSYSLTYGSLGAVIILLTWFYITGLMLLLGAEFNSEIAAAVLEKNLKERGELPPHATANEAAPIQAA